MAEHYAAALRYDPRLPAPFVSASGRGEMAQRLIHIAREAGVPVQNDSELAHRLFWVPAGSIIPEALYEPVAEILSFVIAMDQKVTVKKKSDTTK